MTSVRGGLRAVRSVAGNRALVRVLSAYVLFVLEYAVWIAMLVFAYSRGGATLAGLVAVAQLLPAAAAGPLSVTVADRRSPAHLLVAGYAVQAGGMAATAVAIGVHLPDTVAYGAAVVASTAVATTRPAHATLVPSLAATPDQLTATNVVLGWVEATGIAVAGVMTGALLSLGGAAAVFAVCAALGLVSVLLVTRLTVPSLTGAADSATGFGVLVELARTVALVTRKPRSRLLVALLTGEAVLVGALDLLFVILAITVLGRSQAWAGYLNTAYGVGAILAGMITAMLVGRRLGPAILGSAVTVSAALALLTVGPGAAGTMGFLAVVGGARAILDVAGRSLLQRTVPARLVGQVFGLVEGLTMAGLAAGSLLMPLLVHLGGTGPALLGAAAVLPLAAATGASGLFRLDAVPVPLVEIALLRSLPLFAELPPPALEGIARSLEPVELAAGQTLMRQGEAGDRYYAIAAGELTVLQDGRLLRRCRRGEGVGEIALLRGVPRTATVVAQTRATAYALGRQAFLSAVTGHATSMHRAERIVEMRLATRPEPDGR